MLDVDGMLDCMTPRQMDEWMVYCTIEPMPDSWMQTGVVASTIHNEIESVRCGMAGSGRMNFHEPEQYVPGGKVSKGSHRMTPEEMETKARTMAGLP